MQVTETRCRRSQARAQGGDRPGRAGRSGLPRDSTRSRTQVQLKGFRKGKVPTAHLKKLYGRSVMAEVLQTGRRGDEPQGHLRSATSAPPTSPTSTSTEDKDEIERVLSGQSDLAFTMSYEALPEIAITDLAALKLEREVADVTDEAIDKARRRVWSSAPIRYEVEADRAAGDGDRVTIDFVGRIDGQEFEGGKGEDVQLVIGQVAASSRASSRASPAPRPARSARQRQVPRATIPSRRWPARTPSSPSR